MKLLTLLAGCLLLILPVTALAQEAECLPVVGDAAAQLFAKTGESVAGQEGAGGGTYVELLAGSDSGRVFLRTGTTHSTGAGQGSSSGASSFDTWRIQVSAPTSKSDSLSQIASLDGLSNSFKLEASWKRFTAQRKNPFAAGTVPPTIQCLCDLATAAAVRQGLKPEQAEAMACDARITQFTPELLDQWDAQFWESRFTPYYGLSASVGHEEFEYFDSATFKKEEIDQQPWGVKGSFGFLPSNRDLFVLFGLEYQESFKAADTVTRCPLTGEDFLACGTGAFEKPGKKEKHLVSALARWMFWKNPKGVERIGVSPQLTYDLKSDVLAVDLPIYFARDSKGKLVGGVRLGWNDDVDDVKVGVFVSSKVFGLF